MGNVETDVRPTIRLATNLSTHSQILVHFLIPDSLDNFGDTHWPTWYVISLDNNIWSANPERSVTLRMLDIFLRQFMDIGFVKEMCRIKDSHLSYHPL